MSKPYYETEEYSEAENELDTYDDPVKLVMEYRISEKHKGNKISDLEAKLADIEEKVKHWHDLYNERDKQFQSVRQRYHLLNKLQSNYDKKDKLHLAYMQCLELVEENERLKQQLAEKDKEIERLNLEFETQEDWQEKWQKLYDETCNLNQDKISFAVEQLEKVEVCLKEGIEEAKSLLDPIDYEYYHELLGVGRGYRNSIEIIDNQIEELKKEMK